MKKMLLSVAVTLLVSLITISASAVESNVQKNEEAVAIRSSISEKLQSVDESEMDYDTQARIIREAYRSAGWTEVNGDMKNRSADIAPKTLEIAYMDIDNADNQLRKEILAAREEIIFSHSWVNDFANDGIMVTADKEKRQFSIPPKFSELFPDWDVPECESAKIADEKIEPTRVTDSSIDLILSAAKTAADLLYCKDTWIYKANSSSAASPFYTGYTKEGVINVINTVPTAFKTAGLTNINIGYNNAEGKNMGYELRVPENTDVYFTFSSTRKQKFSVRASTHTSAGTATMLVYREY